jgi:3-oxoacyl-[acyl-carrier-protein] synthase-3
MSWLEFGPEPLVATARPALRRASVLGLGAAVPEGAVANAVIEDRLGVEAGWIERRTGIQSRRVLADGETLVGLTTEACQNALDDANITATDIDLVVAATTGSDELLPNLAPMVATALGMGAVAAYDVGAACTGFVAAMNVASGAVESGRANRVLVIGADAMNRWADPDDRVCAALFGDGAGALILGADGTGEVGPMLLHSDGALSELVWLSRDEPFITMDGQGTYRKAVTSMHDATHEAVAAAGLRIEDVDLFVYHQANRRILASLTERLGVDSGRVVDAISQIGNTSAASLPLALSQARRDGSLNAGDCVLLGAAGAGFCWGAGVLTW